MLVFRPVFTALPFVLLLLVPAGREVCAAEPNWPRWRGPEQNGHTADAKLPVTWSTDNILWKTPLPGVGQSSPIIWGNRIFLTSAMDAGRERIVLCVDRTSGKLLWQQSAWKGDPEPSHVMNGWASASCVTDGQLVVAFFGRGGIHAYTVDGKPLWSRDLGKFEGPWGTAACPILVDNLVIQNCDADTDAQLVALDKKTGDYVWVTPRRAYRGWSTPIVIDTNGRRELVLNGHEGVQAYDPTIGRELWFCKSERGRGEPTVTPAGDVLCVINGLAGGEIYGVRPGGSGDVTATHMAWHTPRKGARDTPSPIVIGKYLLATDMSGVCTCYDTASGREVWKERLPGKMAGSPIAAGSLAFFLNEAGRTIVIEPGPSLKIVAENALPASREEIFRASLTPLEGQWFIRSTTTLYCVGNR